jgi:type IV secretory pathway ATPase VirB11/archaellum biosynthesis ATPase|tara:strand:+ start:366 stop:533 length:168 start_codon:yes stop_codon:yes gene_type:complete
MASIGEHLHALATTAKAMIERIENEPLNVPDTIESNDWKASKDYINKIANRTQNI